MQNMMGSGIEIDCFRGMNNCNFTFELHQHLLAYESLAYFELLELFKNLESIRMSESLEVLMMRDGYALKQRSPLTTSKSTDNSCSSSADQLTSLDVKAALEKFPLSGNSERLQSVMRNSFASRGGDRVAVEYICKWAVSAKSLKSTHVVSIAAAAM